MDYHTYVLYSVGYKGFYIGIVTSQIRGLDIPENIDPSIPA